MNRCKFALTMGGALAMGLAGVANADEALRSEVAQLRQQVAELKGQQNSSWLDQRRAEEVKALIGEVLADADTRASLMADGMVAGHNGTNFFLASPDGGFRLNLSGGIQFRYLLNIENGEGSQDGQDEGFQVRRVRLGFDGHVTAGRRWDYELVLSHEQGADDDADATFGVVSIIDAKVGTQITDNIRVDAGKFKLPFSREELISYKRSLAVERSLVHDVFSLERAEQIQIGYKSDLFLVRGSISDGAKSEYSEIGADSVEIALTARVDVRLMGDWKQAADSTSWQGEATALFLGGAVHYQAGDGANGGVFSDTNVFAWTVDALFETHGFGVMGSVFGAHFDDGTLDGDSYGLVLDVSYNINDKIQPFGRFEYIDIDTPGLDGEAFALTFGFNYFFKGHNAKFTADMVWIVDSDLGAGAGVGTSPGHGFSVVDIHEEDSIVFRFQFQLLF